MKILIIYDSLYGNTEKIAQNIQEVARKTHEVQLKKVKDATPEDLNGIDFLIVGSPTHGGIASEKTKHFFDSLASTSLNKIKAVAYDTGIMADGQNWFMRFVIRFFGYASGNIAKLLENKGANVIATETFFVKSK